MAADDYAKTFTVDTTTDNYAEKGAKIEVDVATKVTFTYLGNDGGLKDLWSKVEAAYYPDVDLIMGDLPGNHVFSLSLIRADTTKKGWVRCIIWMGRRPEDGSWTGHP